jgi:N-acetylglucosamine-6-phosphate deacetylase
MTTTLLYYTNILTSSQVIKHGAIAISDGQITYVGAMEQAPHVDGLKIDLRGKYVAPGFIDIHVHGGKGVSFGESNDPREELEAYSKWVTSNGVTSYLCSLAAPDAISLVEQVSKFADVLDMGVEGAQPVGLHLEGPFINIKRKGAFNPAWLRAPSLEEADSFLKAGRGWIRQMTLAPELSGAQEIAAHFRAAGVVVSMGHTDADVETAGAALRGNFTHVTHTFNAQSGFHHRLPGAFGAIMASDEVTAELIADTIHAHPIAMKVLLRCLGTDRVVLITDAMPGAGLPDGVYDLVGFKVTVKDGHANLPDGTIAGSTVLMNQCVHNIHHLVGVPLPESVKMASLNPARAMGFADHLGSIEVGKDANLVVIDDDVNVYMTIVKGKIVYDNLSGRDL